MNERELLQRAITALICALAHDEAAQHGADSETLTELRDNWVHDAEAIVDEAEQLNFLEDDDD